MPSLKELRGRIGSVKQTQKITSAMKMVAASKLKRAQEQAEASRPFAERMSAMLSNLGAGVQGMPGAPPLLAGREGAKSHLLIVATADRGLAGGFNATIVRGARRRIAELQAEGREVKLICVGRKGRDLLRREYGGLIAEFLPVMAPGQKRTEFTDAKVIADKVIDLYNSGGVDEVSVVFNTFKSAVVQILTFKQLIPVELPEKAEASDEAGGSVYDFEPDEERILTELLPRNVGVQVYKALVENAASEQGARMAAMDNATRNAGDMIKRLSLVYNRQRQAQITKELIEIISGAEAI